MKYTTHAGLQAIIRALESYEVSVDKLVESGRLVIPPGGDGDDRIPTYLIEKIFELALEETQDPAFAFKVVENIPPAAFGEFSIGLLTSLSLRNFLDRMVKYYPYISTAQRLRIVYRDEYAILLSFFADNSIKRDVRSVWVEVTLAFILRFIRLMGNPGYHPVRVELTRQVPSPEGSFTSFFGIAPVYGATRNAMYFPTKDLDVPFPNGGIDLAAEYEERIVKKLAQVNSANLPLRVHAYLTAELPHRFLSKEMVASHFAMSPKTFQNRLEAAGTSYQRLLDSVRREMAELYLTFSSKSLADIADILGYSDASNFCRAYKRWTGHRPRGE